MKAFLTECFVLYGAECPETGYAFETLNRRVWRMDYSDWSWAEETLDDAVAAGFVVSEGPGRYSFTEKGRVFIDGEHR